MARFHTLRWYFPLLLALTVGLSAARAQSGDEPRRAAWAADEVVYDQNEQVITAQGNVEVAYEGNTLFADRVVYDRRTDEARAEGNIRLVDRNGDVVTARSLVLTGDLKNGTIEGLMVLFKDGERLAANRGERVDGDRNILDMAVYSPCEICTDGTARNPVWQIKARRVVHNAEDKTLTYRDAYLELLGVPIAYTPWLRHPDATVKRASGFLTPDFGQSSILGLTVEIPYFWNIAPNMDATITPMITTDERAVLFGEFRHRTTGGTYTFSGSGTYVTKRDNQDNPIPGDEFRGHLFGDGAFDINENWRWGFDLAVASDDTYLRRYNISRADSLINHLYVERFWERSHLSIGGYAFQGLREEDVAGQTPIVVPLVNYEYVSRPGWLGGRFGANANLAYFTRTDDGDTGRLSVGGHWRLPYTSGWGELYTLTLGVRGDAYFINNFTGADFAATPDIVDANNDFEGRVVPYAALEWRLPFLRQARASRQIVEPIVMVVASPNGANNNEIPNEDSQSFDLDTTNLFAIDRFSGYDRWESGVRVAYGMKASHYTNGGVRASLLVGQSYRFRRDFTMPADSGLRRKLSDVVLTATLSVPDVFDYYHRLRFDKDSFKVVRNEGQLAFGPDSFRLYLGYTQLKRNGYDPTLENRDELRAATRIRLSQFWSMTADFSYDFERNGGALTAGGGLTYEDECLRFRISARRDFTEDRDVPPSTSIGFQIVFKIVSDPAVTSRSENNEYNPTFDGAAGPFNRAGYGL